MRFALVMAVMTTLAACGADGAPEPPVAAAPAPATGVSFSGTITVGMNR